MSRASWIGLGLIVLAGCGEGSTAPPEENDDGGSNEPTYINITGPAYVSSIDGEPLPRELWSQDCSDGAFRDSRNRTLEDVTLEFLGKHSDPSVRDRFTGASLSTQRECDGIVLQNRSTFEGEFLATKDSLWLWWDREPVLGMEGGAQTSLGSSWAFEGVFDDQPAFIILVLGSG